MPGLFDELKRRNVLRVGLAYLVGSWLLLQIADVVGPILHLPEAFSRYLLFLLVIGLLPALVFAWIFEWAPEGVKRESEVDHSGSIPRRTDRRLDRAIMVTLTVAVALLLTDKFILSENASPQRAAESTAPARMAAERPVEKPADPLPARAKSVAVLPFVAMSNGPDDDYFSDGLTEEIINALSQLPELLVTARTSAFHFKGQTLPVADIARQLGVSHVVEGSVRRAGERLRITAQLIRATDGFHIWSESYDRHSDDIFAVQEDIAAKVAQALDVVLDDTQRKRMRQRGIRNVEAFIAFQKGRELFSRAHGSDNLIGDLRQANGYLERSAALYPGSAEPWLAIADLYVHILMSQANGELDGNITPQDVAGAPAALRDAYGKAVLHAGDVALRLAAEHDRALMLGHWNGLSDRADRALAAAVCRPPYWIQLTSGTFGKAQPEYEAFARMAPCDPLVRQPWIHMTRARLWLGDPEGGIRAAEKGLQTAGRGDWLTRTRVLALAAAGRFAEAQQAAGKHLRTESEKLHAGFIVAALKGDAQAAAAIEEDYLGRFGPNDYMALMMEAARGNRNEANRLAGQIDKRPFGYMALMHAVYWCTCGAPFDLEATPVFAGMLADSGLPWPPRKPVDFPLKDW